MKTNFVIALLVTLFSLSAVTDIQAQKSRRRAPAKGTPKVTTAPSEEETTKAAPAPKEDSILSVEAGLVYKSGDVKPVARVTFYLLDKSLDDIMNEAGLEDAKLEKFSKGAKYFAVLNFEKRKYGDVRGQYALAENAIKPHIIATMTTDFGGKGEFPAVKAGSYYIMGVGGPEAQVVVWNLATTLKSGKQSVTLDQENAAQIF